jgi:putative cell wall-binding protein
VPSVTTIAGPDRTATAVAASQQEFPDGGAGAVALARDDLFPEGLTGVPLAVAKHAPLLLSDPDNLNADTATEIVRVLAKGGTVYLLGGTYSLSATVADQVAALGYVIQRIGGATRYDTATDIAQALGDPTTVFEADGTDFPDALSAASAAVLDHGAILLTEGSVQSAATAAYLGSVHPTRYALGGPAAAADPGATPIVGADRYATSAMVAAQFFPQATEVGAATGENFPDALTGGTTMAAAGDPLVLVAPTFTSVAALPPTLASYLSSLKGVVTQILVFGGVYAVPIAVGQTLQQAVG